MKVIETEPDFFEITHNQRWWTAKRNPQGWFIVSDYGRLISNTGATGRRILAAIAERNRVGVGGTGKLP